MDHSSTGQVVDFNDQQKRVVITSLSCTLMSKIKLIFQNPLKNKQLAANQNLLSIIELIGENLLPHYCNKNYKNSQKLSYMHSLIYLLTSKIQAVFTSGVIKTCIDQNWDLKGFKAVLLRVLHELGLPNQPEEVRKLQEVFDKLIQSQNLQSQSCIKAISYYLKNRNKANIDEDDLKNPIVSFQTTFDFVKEEIQKFRSQNMSHTCFTVLHPWAYDLDLVDFKYVINKDQTVKVSQALEGCEDAQVFWLSYFKSQTSCSADEFVVALKELAEMNNNSDVFDQELPSLCLFLHQSNFVINIKDHKQQIIQYIQSITKDAKQINILHDQVKLRQEARPASDYIDESKLHGFRSEFSQSLSDIPNIKLVNLNNQQSSHRITFKRIAPTLQPATKQSSNLYLKFTNVDTEELKDLEIKFDGNLAQFKVGEGDCNHYIICNDKKLWESQFMILNKDGKYYIRDLGIVHTSRIKVNSHTSLQIHQGALLDLGKVVHYHVDKLLHEKVPSQQSNSNFIVMKGSQANYKEDDEALLRARPTWISADENKDLVQNEIILENSEKSVFSVGRSNKRDVEIKLKAVSADHCKIEYNREKGWFVHEKDKDRLSSNGTFVFMKSLQQMEDHEPSDFIPLFDGMTVSFINYELQVRIENKTSEEFGKCEFLPLDKINANVAAHSGRQSSRKNDDEDRISQKSEKNAKPNKQDDVYQEELVATHAQKSQPQFVEEQKSVKSLHSQHSHHSKHDDDDQQEEVKSSHSQSQQQLDQSQHSHRSSKHSLHNQSQQLDQYEDNQKSTKSLKSQKDLDQQSVHNQSVHSQHSHHDPNDDQVEEQHEPSIHSQSQKSLRQSVQSAKDLIVDDQQQQDDFQVHHTEEDIKDDYQEIEKKSQLSQRSVHGKSTASIHDQIEEQVSQQQQQTHHNEDEEVKSHKQSVHDQLDDSPKAVSKVSLKDDEERQEMQRSYSQHHIAEILDQVSQHSKSQHQLIHSDDEEEDVNQQPAQQHQQDDDQQAVVHNQSVHDDTKSHRSQKSQKSIQQHQDADEVFIQPVNNQDNQSVHDQSHQSLHQPSQSKHDQSQHSLHQDDQDEDLRHNQSVHSIAASHKQDVDLQEEVKSQKSVHNQSVHNQSVHDDEVASVHNQSQAQLSHRSNKSQASPSKDNVIDQHHEEDKHEVQHSPPQVQHSQPHEEVQDNQQHHSQSVDKISHHDDDQQQQPPEEVQHQQDPPNDE